MVLTPVPGWFFVSVSPLYYSQARENCQGKFCRFYTSTADILAPGGAWTETVIVTVDVDYAGPLTNVVQVMSLEGVLGDYTQVSTSVKWHYCYLPLVLKN